MDGIDGNGRFSHLMTEQSILFLRELLGDNNVIENEPMAVHTSFRTGGPADLFLRVSSLEQLQQVLRRTKEEQEPCFILGRGTNLLVGDRGFRGCVITMADNTAPVTDTAEETDADERGSNLSDASFRGSSSLGHVLVQGTIIKAGAGASMSGVANAARDHGLSGFEFASGIPGSIGGGLVMNAGAYDGGMDQVVRSARLLMPDGKILDVPRGDMRFGYRRSVLKEIPAIALEATLELTQSETAAVDERMKDLNRRRREKQPLEYPSAGSTFKRPEGHFAGKLIMEAGMRGFRIGGAAVSEKHCGFVINVDHATSADILAVIRAVQEKVLETSGIRLEQEVICLGDF